MADKKKPKDGQVEEAQANKTVAVPAADEREKAACNPIPANKDKFNQSAVLLLGTTHAVGLELLGAWEEEPANHHSQRVEIRVREDDEELDLSR